LWLLDTTRNLEKEIDTKGSFHKDHVSFPSKFI
jgi:hypothetical protein